MSSKKQALLTALELEIEGAFGFQYPPTKIPLDKQGCVLICGRNGAGKTTIPETLTHNMYQQTSMRMASKLRGGSIVNNNIRSGYFSRFKFKTGPTDIELLQALEHATYKKAYEIRINGRDKTPLKKPEQKKDAAKLIPLTYEEWMGIGYMAQNSVHDLLSGKPSEKKSYITSVFGLSVYDDLYEVAVEEKKTLEKTAAAAIEIQETIANLKADIKKLQKKIDKAEEKYDLDELSKLVKDADRKYQKHTAALATFLSQENAVKELRSAKDEYNEALADCGDVEVGDLADVIQETKDKLKRLREKGQKVEATLSSVAKNRDKLARLKKAIRTRRKVIDKLKGEKKRILKVNPYAKMSKDEYEELDAYVLDYGSLIDKVFKAYDGERLEPKKADAAACLADYRQHKKNLEKIKDLDDGACPTCLQPVDKKTRKEMAKAEKKAAAASLRLAVRALEDAAPSFVREKLLPNMPLTKVRGVWRTAREAGNIQYQLAEEEKQLKDLTSRLDDLNVDEDVDVDDLKRQQAKNAKQREKASDKLDNLLDLKVAYKAYRKVKAAASGVEDVTEEAIKDAKRKKKASRQKYEGMRDKHQELAQLYSNRDILKEQLVNVEVRARAESENALNLEGLKGYTIPFLSALRAAKVQECVSVVDQVLPIYVDAMFGEEYKGAEASLEVSDDMKDIDLILKTQGWKKPVTASQASGGERGKFSLAMMAALREVTPRPTNVMFLDEPFNNMESVAKMLFLERCMPTMMERCPGLTSMFIIAHDKEILDGPTSVWDDVWHITNSRKKGSQVNMGCRLSRIPL